MLGERVAQFADRAVLVVGEDVDDDRRAARPVGFVLRLFVRHARLFARPAANGALDVVGGHVVRLRVGDDPAQPGIHVGIAAAGAGGDRQLLDEAGENLPALGVEGALLVLDRGPLGMAGHVKTPENQRDREARKCYHKGRSKDPRRTRILACFRARMIQTSARSSQRPAAVVAEHRIDREPGAFETAGDLPDRQRAKRQLEPMLGGTPTPPLDVPLLECRQIGEPDPAGPIRSSVRCTPPAACPRSCTRLRVLPPVGHVGNEIDPEGAAGRRTLATDCRAAPRSRSRKQRLEDAVRRQHHRERARAERQRANVAAHQVQMAAGSDRPAALQRFGPALRAREHRRRIGRRRRARPRLA